MNGFKRRGNVYIVPTDEYNTSQTCAECFGRFDRATLNDRFKVCQNCRPHPAAMLPSIIVTQRGRRDLNEFRKLSRQMNEELASKVVIYRKWWADSQAPDFAKKTVWHRDIAAAKCILIKGKLSIETH